MKPKIKKAIPIPFELRDAFHGVVNLLEEKERNPDDVNIDFDDAIQIGGLCGGRNRRGYLDFTWHLGTEPRCKWFFSLHEFEIQNYAHGIVSELQLYMCDTATCMCGSALSEFTCFHCDYVETDPTALQMRRRAISITSKEQFVAEMLQLEPTATWARVLTVFQLITGLGERVGWFSASELKAMIEKLKS